MHINQHDDVDILYYICMQIFFKQVKQNKNIIFSFWRTPYA